MLRLGLFALLGVCVSVIRIRRQPLLLRRLLVLLCCTASVALAAQRAAVTHGAARARRTAGRATVVGYFGQWSLYEKFSVHSLVTSGAAGVLDQINYAQGFVTGGRCSVADPNADLNVSFAAAESVSGRADDPHSPFRGNLHQLAELKRRYPRLKVLISLEGRASDYAADAQPAARERFVRSCMDLFVRGHLAPGVDAAGLFDGIDLDWEYPEAKDAANFLALLEELRRGIDAVRPGMRLSIAVGISPENYLAADLAAISRVVDQVGVMNYDYSGPWSKTTGLLAPLHAAAGFRGGTVDASIEAWADAGVPRAKLLMGLPFYGYGWRGVAREGNGLFQQGTPIRGDRPYSFFEALLRVPADRALKSLPEDARMAAAPALTASSPAPAVPVSGAMLPHAVRAAPLLLFREPQSRAPWLYDGDTFWTFEDATSIREKARYAREQHLGGVMVWELSEDASDAALLRAAANGLRARAQ